MFRAMLQDPKTHVFYRTMNVTVEIIVGFDIWQSPVDKSGLELLRFGAGS